MRRRHFTNALLAAPALASAQAFAQIAGGRPIRLILGQAAGGAVDTIARNLAERLGTALGQPVIVDARPGAGGMVAAEAVARAAPDGTTLGLLDVGALAVNPILQQKIRYDVAKDFGYLGLVARIPLVLIAHPGLPVANLGELTAYLRQNPGKVSYASAGVGSPLHLAMEAYKQRAGVSAVHIPYRGGAPALADLLSGQIQLMFLDTNLTSQYTRDHKVKALAVATLDRNVQLPTVPTFHEGGVRGFEFSPWVGLVGPAGMPAELAARLEHGLREVMAGTDLATRLQSLGFVPVKGTGQQFGAFAASELQTYRSLIQQQGIRLDP